MKLRKRVWFWREESGGGSECCRDGEEGEDSGSEPKEK